MAKQKEPKIVEIEWEDAISYGNGWEADGVEYEPMKCSTVGYLKDSNKKFVSVYQNSNAQNEVGNIMVIPRVWITKMKVRK
jgi:hypothetical protein